MRRPAHPAVPVASLRQDECELPWECMPHRAVGALYTTAEVVPAEALDDELELLGGDRAAAPQPQPRLLLDGGRREGDALLARDEGEGVEEVAEQDQELARRAHLGQQQAHLLPVVPHRQ